MKQANDTEERLHGKCVRMANPEMKLKEGNAVTDVEEGVERRSDEPDGDWIRKEDPATVR